MMMTMMMIMTTATKPGHEQQAAHLRLPITISCQMPSPALRSTRKAIAKAKETHRSQFHTFWIRDFGLGTWTWDFGFLILHFGLLSFLRGQPHIPWFGFLIFDFRVLALLGRGLRTQNRPRVILELYERSQGSRFGFCRK